MMMRYYDQNSPPNAPLGEQKNHVDVRLVWVPFVKYLNIFVQRLVEDVSGSKVGGRNNFINFVAFRYNRMCG
jgi:hypothetical protein